MGRAVSDRYPLWELTGVQPRGVEKASLQTAQVYGGEEPNVVVVDIADTGSGSANDSSRFQTYKGHKTIMEHA